MSLDVCRLSLSLHDLKFGNPLFLSYRAILRNGIKYSMLREKTSVLVAGYRGFWIRKDGIPPRKSIFFNRGFRAVLAGVICLCSLVFNEIKKLQKRLKLFPDVVEDREKFSYSDERSDIDFENVQQKLKRLVITARLCSSDISLFSSSLPHLSKSSNDSAEDELKRLLSCLPLKGTSKCTKYFMDAVVKRRVKAMSVFDKEAIWTFDGNSLLMPLVSREPADKQNIIYLLQAVLGHSKIDTNCTELVKKNGLELLRRIYDENEKDKTVIHLIGRILSNVALYRWLHKDLFISGWITVFARWLRSADFVLSMLAAKSLANLDADRVGSCVYPEAVYLYHPQYIDGEPIYVDIVFVHGLLGGPFKTWRQQDWPKIKSNNNSSPASKQHKKKNAVDDDDDDDAKVVDSSTKGSNGSYTFCWPKDWLAVDCPGVRLLTVDFETRLSEWAAGCPYDVQSIDALSVELLYKLREAGVGSRPVIWVGHSMGGLLIKKMLCTANDDPVLHDLVKQTKGILFYSVPHNGSSLARLIQRVSYLVYPSIEVRQLEPGSTKLRVLHDIFKELLFERGIPLLSFAEGQTTNLPFSIKAKIVPEESSDPGFGEFHVMSQLNHLNICKPEKKDTELYRLTLAFIRDCLSLIKLSHSSN